MTIGSIQIPQLVYQGQGSAGDTFTILCAMPDLVIHTFGSGPTNNGANIHREYAPELARKLPMGSTDESTDLARDAIYQAGATFSGVSYEGIARLRPGVHSSLMLPFTVGLSLALSATAGTRGFRVAPSSVYGWGGPDINASVMRSICGVFLVEITTPGAGSNFSAGNLALFVFVRTPATASAWGNLWTGDNTDRAGDLFKIPSDLL
jgi:hypothetical protein